MFHCDRLWKREAANVVDEEREDEESNAVKDQTAMMAGLSFIHGWVGGEPKLNLENHQEKWQ